MLVILQKLLNFAFSIIKNATLVNMSAMDLGTDKV